jgi:hypothetical protein
VRDFDALQASRAEQPEGAGESRVGFAQRAEEVRVVEVERLKVLFRVFLILAWRGCRGHHVQARRNLDLAYPEGLVTRTATQRERENGFVRSGVHADVGLSDE